MIRRSLAVVLIFITSLSPAATPVDDAPQGMVWVEAGEFTMGTDDPNSFPNERPAHRVRLTGFWIDKTPVTNAEFTRFVEATGYTTIAERPVDWEVLKKQVPQGTPKPPDEMLQPGSLVFTPPDHAMPLSNMTSWWTWTTGASWRAPEGPGSTIEDRQNHPVVQVAWDDAVAYAEWAHKRLPSEAEWEYASWGGHEGTRFYWGDEFRPDGKYMTNTFTGAFPHKNTVEDGYERTSPVDVFPPNGYGLFDMAGNTWEWTADRYRADRHARLKLRGLVSDPTSPAETYYPGDPQSSRRVIKGGSFLCHVAYCESYRPTARRGTPPDTGSAHVGFRCALSDAHESE